MRVRKNKGSSLTTNMPLPYVYKDELTFPPSLFPQIATSSLSFLESDR
jgi:hypothetical protein